ncbi:unnamed protein product [Trifolium pratense]|uniref:Uncharacterized protein n=1 Tax=Trifolium pratense TaxID=57577 RepID=A0ACB0L8T1_TRIPR|nr:unnamed protein product [Trifolium pratense]
MDRGHIQDISSSTTTQKPSINKIPYSTARLSHSVFNYSFPVTIGPKYLRLFFYPSTYTDGFNRYDASFTVISNGFTLLKDFNASLSADFEGVDTIYKEYIIYVGDDRRLDLSFIPSNGNSTNYAFINGIEVLSMPNDLYYTSPDDHGFSLVDTSYTQYSIQTNVALETDYRIRVGVQATESNIKDTNMLRNWNSNDTNYLRTPTSRDFISKDVTGTKNITVTPDYMAPKDLFRTSRDLGTNGTLNKLLNLTWEFPVDTGFYYLIRLHFCELDPMIKTQGDRVFIIYLQGCVAEDQADVLKWTDNQNGLAVHRNYAVFIPKSDDYYNNKNKKVNISLQMHPYSNSRETEFSDPFLNGLEIFKISDIDLDNLAGPNPDLIQDLNYPQVQEKKSKQRIGGMTIIEVIFEVVFGVMVISLVVFFVLRGKRETKEKKSKTTKESKSSTTSKWGPLSFSTTKSTKAHKIHLYHHIFAATFLSSRCVMPQITSMNYSLLALEDSAMCTKGTSTKV